MTDRRPTSMGLRVRLAFFGFFLGVTILTGLIWIAVEHLVGQPEIQVAVHGHNGSARYARRMKKGEHTISVPLRPGSPKGGALHVSIATDVLTRRLARLRGRLLVGWLCFTLLAVGLAELLARSYTRPVARLVQGLQAMDAAPPDEARAPLPEAGPAEFHTLSRALNRMQSEIHRQYQVLEVQHNRLERILTKLDDGIIVADPAGEVVFANPASLRILGVDRAALLERDFSGKDDVVSRVLASMAEAGERSYQLEVPESDRHLLIDTLEISWGYELARGYDEPRQKRGSRAYPDRDARSAALPLGLPPELNARVALLRDISSFVRLDRMRGEFVANASHELRTPIAAVAAALEALELGAIGDPASRDAFLARARRAVDRLSRLADDLLDLSVAEGTPEGGADAACDAADVAFQVVTSAMARAQDCGLKLTLSVPETAAPVPIREVDLLRVVGNVVDNSVKHTPPGGSVAVEVARWESEVDVVVTDTGTGIDPAHLDRIFERFYRADRSRSDGGAGLGLTIARHLVERSGGRISAENVPEGGARLLVALPLLRAPRKRDRELRMPLPG